MLAGNRTLSGVRRLEFGRHLVRLVVAESSQCRCESARRKPDTRRDQSTRYLLELSGHLDRPLLAERAHCGAATERPVLQRNGHPIRRAQDREGSTAADERCPIERPETGRPEIEQRGLTALRMSEGDEGRATLGEPEPRSQPIGSQSRPDWRSMPYAASTVRRRCFPVKLQTRVVPQQPTMPLNDADFFAPFALPQVQCQSSTPACCVPVIATCASIQRWNGASLGES